MERGAAGEVIPNRSGTRCGSARAWDAVWPRHVPFSFDYPAVPAWWLLERNLPRHANRPAVRCLDRETLAEGTVLTYEALFAAARNAAAGLARVGVARGDRVGLWLPNSAELVIGYYATWMAGAVAVPVNPYAHAHELEAQLADAGTSLLIGGTAAAPVATRLGIPFVPADGATDGPLALSRLMADGGATFRPVAISPDEDGAVLLYTGGTTGAPKGVLLTHRNLVANTIQFAEWYAFEPGAEVSMCVLPLSHSGGMSGAMNVPLYAGATLLVLPRFNAAAVGRAVGRYRATRLFGVPTMFIALLNSQEGRRADYTSLRACRTNAAPLPPSVKAAFDGLVGHEVLVEGYGLTETGPLTHANPLQRAKPGSIGIPIADTDAKLVDMATGGDLPAGEAGELVLKGPQVMQGYWNRPDETAAAMAGGWFHTGDVARMDDEGYFVIVDRLKDQINTAGFKVWPREVEEVLYAHPAVKLAAVIGVQDDYRGEAVKACVVLKDEQRGRVTGQDLMDFCKARLTTYKVPRLVEFREELPVNSAGKLLRRLLREG